MQLIVGACQRLQKHRPTGAVGVPAPFFVHDRCISPSRSHSSRLYHPPRGRRKRAAPFFFQHEGFSVGNFSCRVRLRIMRFCIR